MAKTVDFRFIRVGQVNMTGACSIEVDDNATEEQIQDTLDSGTFKEFLPLQIDWYNDAWEFVPAVTNE